MDLHGSLHGPIMPPPSNTGEAHVGERGENRKFFERGLKDGEYYLDENKILKSKIPKKATRENLDYYTTQAIYREVCKNLPKNSAEYNEIQAMFITQYNKAAPNIQGSKNPFSDYSKSVYNRNQTNAMSDHVECKIGAKLDLAGNGWSYKESWVDNQGVCFLLEESEGERFHFQDILSRQMGDSYKIIHQLEELENLQNSQTCIDVTPLLAGDGVDLQPILAKLASKKGRRPAIVAFKQFEGKSLLLLSPCFGDVEKFKKLLVNNGFVLSADSLSRMWLKVAESEEIFAIASVPETELALPGKGFPHIYDSYESFLVDQKNTFDALIQASSGPKGILAKAMVSLLEGIPKALRGNSQYAGDLNALFEAKKLTDLLQCSYFRIQNALKQATLAAGDLLEFVRQLDLVNQEIQMMLTIAKPYEEDALAKIVVERLQTGDKGIIPEEMKVSVSAQASGMRCISDIACSVQAQKGPGGLLGVLTLKDSYYESAEIFQKAKGMKNEILNGDDFNVNPEKALAHVDKIDLFLAEFHHNISANRTSYTPEKVALQIKNLFKYDKVQDKLTVIIDTTIDIDLSEDVKELFADDVIRGLIKEGKLNINLVRSSQKYDMLGFDNYYGGLIISVHNGLSFAEFDKRIADRQDQLDGINYQGLCHLQQCAAESIMQYQSAIADNCRHLYNILPEGVLVESKGIVRVSKREDEKIPFLDIKFDKGYGAFQSIFKNLFVKYCAFKNLPLTQRASFGFANANYIQIQRDEGITLRLNMGLESRPQLEEYANFFREVDLVIQQWQQSPAFLNLEAAATGIESGVSASTAYVEGLLQVVEGEGLVDQHTGRQIASCKSYLARIKSALQLKDYLTLSSLLSGFWEVFETFACLPAVQRHIGGLERLQKVNSIKKLVALLAGEVLPASERLSADLYSRLQMHHFHCLSDSDERDECNRELLQQLNIPCAAADATPLPVDLKLERGDDFKSVIKVKVAPDNLRDAIEVFVRNLSQSALFKDLFLAEEPQDHRQVVALDLNEKIYLNTKASSYQQFVNVLKGALSDVLEVHEKEIKLLSPNLNDSTELIPLPAALWAESLNVLKKRWQGRVASL